MQKWIQPLNSQFNGNIFMDIMDIQRHLHADIQMDGPLSGAESCPENIQREWTGEFEDLDTGIKAI